MLWAAQSTAGTSCVCPCLADCRQGDDTREDGMVTPGSGCHHLYLSQILGHPHCDVWALLSCRAYGAYVLPERGSPYVFRICALYHVAVVESCSGVRRGRYFLLRLGRGLALDPDQCALWEESSLVCGVGLAQLLPLWWARLLCYEHQRNKYGRAVVWQAPKQNKTFSRKFHAKGRMG